MLAGGLGPVNGWLFFNNKNKIRLLIITINAFVGYVYKNVDIYNIPRKWR
jgi:hypothetical protein